MKAASEQVPVVTALYVPGDRPDRFDKAVAAGPDVVILDLEDAVAPAAKEAARAAVAGYLSRGDRTAAGPVRIQVRVNARGTRWYHDDLVAIRDLSGLDGVRLPKVESADDIAAAAALTPGVPLHALVETAVGVQALPAVAGAGVATVGLGEADLASDLGVDDEQVMDQIRTRMVIAARAASLPPPMMSVYTALADEEGLAESCRRGRRRGFVGRAAIHPRQLPAIRAAFTPPDAEVDRARAILDALARPGASGVAVLADGSMVDAAMLRGAERVLALADLLRPSP